MGSGAYNYEAHTAISTARAAKPREEVFVKRSVTPEMSPHGVKVRESRDSEGHPHSLGIIFALDVTGSMGDIPEKMAKESLPHFMRVLLALGINDPQILFMAVGDVNCDRSPLQVGQFESTAELMDRWLTEVHLEGGGGGGNSESYEMAMYWASQHTSMDCLVKRRKKGYFFMTGDEKPYEGVSKHQYQNLTGFRAQGGEVSVQEAVRLLCDSFCPFFLIPIRPGVSVGRVIEARWRELLGDHVILAYPEDMCYVCAGIVALQENGVKDVLDLSERLEALGLSLQQTGRIMQAITPFAALSGRDGVPPFPEAKPKKK